MAAVVAWPTPARAADAGTDVQAELARLTQVVTENLPQSWELADPSVLTVFGARMGNGSAVAFAPRGDAGTPDALLVLRFPLETVTEAAFLAGFGALDADDFCKEDQHSDVRARGRFSETREAYGCVTSQADGGAEAFTSFQAWVHHGDRILMFDCLGAGTKRAEAIRTCGETVEDIAASLNPTPEEERGRKLIEEMEQRERELLAALKRKYSGRTKVSSWTKTGWRATRWGMGHLDAIKALGLSEKDIGLDAYDDEPDVLYLQLPDELLLGASTFLTLRFEGGRMESVKLRTTSGVVKSDAFCKGWTRDTVAMLDEKYGESTCVMPEATRKVCHWNKRNQHFITLKVSFRPQIRKEDRCSAEIEYADPVALSRAVDKMLRDAERERKADLEKF